MLRDTVLQVALQPLAAWPRRGMLPYLKYYYLTGGLAASGRVALAEARHAALPTTTL